MRPTRWPSDRFGTEREPVGDEAQQAHDASGSECGLLLLVYLYDAASVALLPEKRARQPGPHGLLGLVKLQKSPADRERISIIVLARGGEHVEGLAAHVGLLAGRAVVHGTTHALESVRDHRFALPRTAAKDRLAIDARERVRGELFRGTGNYHRIIVSRIHGERSAILNLHFEFVLHVCEQRILKIECPVISREIDFHA